MEKSINSLRGVTDRGSRLDWTDVARRRVDKTRERSQECNVKMHSSRSSSRTSVSRIIELADALHHMRRRRISAHDHVLELLAGLWRIDDQPGPVRIGLELGVAERVGKRPANGGYTVIRHIRRQE